MLRGSLARLNREWEQVVSVVGSQWLRDNHREVWLYGRVLVHRASLVRRGVFCVVHCQNSRIPSSRLMPSIVLSSCSWSATMQSYNEYLTRSRCALSHTSSFSLLLQSFFPPADRLPCLSCARKTSPATFASSAALRLSCSSFSYASRSNLVCRSSL